MRSLVKACNSFFSGVFSECGHIGGKANLPWGAGI